ncbi:MAG TPA: cbb3-type cytochrome c oxidase subunit I [Bryobacteraceae bacterium]|jgi:cytochrome c oxidase subunit 1|nr:cbb3-type cytochrome c oxidase subunit I [Bryobacteraceae bacterium]
MEHTLTSGNVTADRPRPAKNYLNETTGLWSWMSTVDHKRIGIMYLGAVSFAFLLGGIFALLVRLSLLNPQHTLFGKQWVTAEMYNRFFTLHGAIMVFLFIIPSIPASLANFVLPMMLGAKDVAFPRLNLTSFYLWVAGAALAIGSMVLGAVDTGWTFYTPYSTTTDGAVGLMTLAVFILGFSSIFTGLNFIATTHKLRAPGMGWFDMPLFVWGIYATGVIQILATPVLAITMVLLLIERVFQIGIFDSRIGGDPVLFQHFFWFYSHPAVYIMILPGMAIISEIIPTFSRKTIFGYRAIAYSSVSLALLSFIVWGHHLFVAGESDLANVIFSALTFLVAIPSGVKMFNWLTTMYKGNISFETPMLYAMAFLFLFAIGGLTGIFFATLAVDIHLTDTYFVVAHFHYVMMGGTVIAFLGGLHYWWPKMTGRMYSEKWGRVACALVFIGFNMTFGSQFIMGGQGMPRRYFNYLDQFQPIHAFSTYGSWVLGSGLFLTAIYLLASLKTGPLAPDSPWGGTTMEWESSSPPVVHNFEEQPVFEHEPYDYRHRTVTHV